MTDIRIQTFPIPGLEYVFVPPGLPLVTKSDSFATTSILVRGGAGTGKTTLAVALAHAISKACEGVTLYLSTEFVATEIPYKAAALQLPENSIAPWDNAGNRAPGSVLVRHLLQTQAGEKEQNLLTVGARKRAAIAAVWESLTTSGEPSALRSEGPPVRAVVLDAFGLPEAETEDPGLRNELLTLIQSLEYVGITPILVEEANSPAQTWISFVVDIVFETELSSADDTGNLLLRRLKCPKSRYGQALPGPHDYGLDVSTGPAVWPDLAFSNTWTPLRVRENSTPTFFIPQGDRFGFYPAGSIVISNWSDKHPFIHAFEALPGITVAELSCGPLMKLALDGNEIYMSEGQGIFAVAWTLIRAFQAKQINAVSIINFEFLLDHPITRARSLRAIAMLSATGMSICLHGSVDILSSATVIADCVQGRKYAGTHFNKRAHGRFCRADRWLPQFVEPHTDPEDGFNRALTLHLKGVFAAAYSTAGSLEPESRAKFLMLVGDDLAAAKLIHPVPRYPEFARMWENLSAIHAKNTVALEKLASNSETLDVHDLISLLRALAKNMRIAEVIGLVDTCRTRWNLPTWYTSRLSAELFVDALGGDWSSVDIRTLFDNVTKFDELPAEHRAEICYNLSILGESRDREAASAARQRARELNPEFDVGHGP